MNFEKPRYKSNLYWVSKKNKIAISEKLKAPEVRSSKNILHSVSGFFFSLIASIIGAGFATIFTLNYLEPFKAEENLRKFALSDLYKPMRTKSQECLALRSQIYTGNRQIHLLLNIGNTGLKRVLKEPETASKSLSLEVIKPMMDQLNLAIKKTGEDQILLRACTSELNSMRNELATVLGINEQFNSVLATHKKNQPKELSAITPNNKFVEILEQPDKLFSLLQAAQDGADGHITRALAASQKFSQILDELTSGYKSSFIQEQKVILATTQENNDVNTLFLRDLKNRFEKTPTSYFKESFPLFKN